MTPEGRETGFSLRADRPLATVVDAQQARFARAEQAAPGLGTLIPQAMLPQACCKRQRKPVASRLLTRQPP